MRLSIAFALLCAALHAAPARAQQPQPQPQLTPQQPPRTFHLVLTMGIDGGSDTFGTVRFTDGSTQDLNAGAGFSMAAGLSFLETQVGAVTLDALTTIGFKAWDAGADNGQYSYLGFPLEVLARIKVQQFRFGAGIDYAISPKTSTSGVLSGTLGADQEFENALGFVMEGDWAVRQPGAKAGFFIGGKVVVQTFDSKTYPGLSYKATSYGVNLGLEI